MKGPRTIKRVSICRHLETGTMMNQRVKFKVYKLISAGALCVCLACSPTKHAPVMTAPDTTRQVIDLRVRQHNKEAKFTHGCIVGLAIATALIASMSKP